MSGSPHSQVLPGTAPGERQTQSPLRRFTPFPPFGRSGFAAGWGERSGWVVRTGRRSSRRKILV